MPIKKRKPASRKAKLGSKGMEPLDCRLEVETESLRDVVKRVNQEGGIIVGSCKDPLGGKPLVFAVLPIDRVEPTPFRRDLSEAHHKKLAGVIEKTGHFSTPSSLCWARSVDSGPPTAGIAWRQCGALERKR